MVKHTIFLYRLPKLWVSSQETYRAKATTVPLKQMFQFLLMAFTI